MFGIALLASPASAQEAATIERGVKVYAAQKCHVCHSLEGKGTTAAKKGPLDGVGSKLTEEEIRLWIVDAVDMTKKTKSTRKPFMKNYKHLPSADVDALVAYIGSLKKS